MMDVKIMNMPCSTLEDMIEVTCKVFGPALTETIPFPPLLVFSNVIDHLAVRGKLNRFEPERQQFTEEFVTNEVTAYLDSMRKVVRLAQRKRTDASVIFVSPPGYIHLPRQLQQFLYLVTEAAHARDLPFYIVAPNLRISAMTWRPCDTSYLAFLAEISKAVQVHIGPQGNARLLPDDATAFDYGMQMACRTYDENGVRQINDPTEAEHDNLIDNLWYERRDEATKDEKTHNPKSHKELVALFEKTATIKEDRIDAMVFP